MKYPLNKKLYTLAKVKMIANPKLLPAMNSVLECFKCKSDNQVDVKNYRIAGYQNAELSVLVIEPKSADGILPGVVLFHGGGFMLKASGSHYLIAKEYAAKLPCRVIYVDYRLAPEFPFPTPVEDCYLTYQWVLEHAKELKVDRNKIMIAGDSAGGNLAASVSLMARDRGLSIPYAAMLIYPVTDRRMMTESMKKYTDAPVWDANLTKMMWKAYLGDQKPEKIEYASPVEVVSLAGFPAAYVEVAEYDCLRDEGILFAERLRSAGIPVELHETKEACHGYETAVKCEITRNCMERRISWMKKMLK